VCSSDLNNPAQAGEKAALQEKYDAMEAEIARLNGTIPAGWTEVHKNFTVLTKAEDKAADKALQRHIVATRLPEWKSLTTIPVRREPAAQKSQPKASHGRVSVPELPGVSYPSETLIDDPWARYDDLPTEYQDDLEASEPVDLIDVDELCWDGNEFDLVTYQAIIEANDEQAREIVAELKATRQGGRSARLRAV